MYNIEIKASSIFDLRQQVTKLHEELTNDYLGRHGSAVPTTEDVSTDTVVENINTVSLVVPQNMTIERDSKGMPFDLRIHSEKKSKNLDGSWRYKRGVKDDAIALVESELNHSVGIAPPAVNPTVLPSAPPPPITTVVNEAPQFAPPPQAPVVQAPIVVSPAIVSQITAAPEALPQPASVKPAHSLITFKNNLMDVFAQFINEKKIDQAYIDSLIVYFAKTNPSVKNIWNILSSEKQCIEMFDIFCNAGWITRVEG